MSADDDSSELSSLSSLSPVPSDNELEEGGLSDASAPKSKAGILKFFPKLSEQPAREPSPPPRKRSPSPPHEYVLADNPDIAFIVMFRSRFDDAFPRSLANFGPQELERDVVAQIPGDRAEAFLCAVLGLLLNRKQDVKPGHYGRALEDAISTHKNQWAPSWEGKNPLAGGASFSSMTPTERLTLLRTLVLWSLSSSDTVKALINQAYKQNRHEDDLNQPKSVQPWGSDGDKRRYFLIEGQDDTAFRVYRESNPAGTNRTWWSVAGSIDELKVLAEKLETKDGGPKATKLNQKMMSAIPRFEAGEDKRKRREYRQMRKEQFKRPEPGFSLYEGRTRGKRIKYTYSDDEDMLSDSTTRRSARNTGTNTPIDNGPLTTASGRQIRAPTRLNAAGGDGTESVNGDVSEYDRENLVGPTGRPKRSAAVNHGTTGWTESTRGARRKSDDSEEGESEAEFGDDEEDADEHVPEEFEDEDEFEEEEGVLEEDDVMDDQPRSLVVKFSVTSPRLQNVLTPGDKTRNGASDPATSQPNGKLASTKESHEEAKKDIADTSASHELTDVSVTQTPNLAPPEAVTKESNLPPPTPVSAHVSSLALRGSPEKAHRQPIPQPIDVGAQK